MARFGTYLLLVPLALLNFQSAVAVQEPAPPQDLQAIYDSQTRTATISWAAPSPGSLVYRVYRDESFLGKTDAASFHDGDLPMDQGWIYIVTAAEPGGAWSAPAVTALPGISCEVVNLSTSWDYPYLYAHLHEECLGGVAYDKHVTWIAEN